MSDAWARQAAALVAEYAAEVGGTFTVEDVRLWAGDRCPPTPDLRAWNLAVKLAARTGAITRHGHSRSRTKRGRTLCAYRAAFFSQERAA